MSEVWVMLSFVNLSMIKTIPNNYELRKFLSTSDRTVEGTHKALHLGIVLVQLEEVLILRAKG